MALSPIPEERKAQLTAIDINLATAPDIQEDLKAEYGYGENKFFQLDLFEYRINNSLLDIAEDLDVKSLYGLTTDKVADISVGRAFRGHHNEDFKPEYQFEGLFSEEMNDMIEKIRASKGALITVENKTGIYGRTPEEHSEHSRKGGRIGGRKLADMINPETEERYVVEGGLRGYWKDNPKHLDTLDRIVGASIGKGKYITKPSWDYVHTNFNEETGLKMSKKALQCVQRRYNSNRDEEE